MQDVGPVDMDARCTSTSIDREAAYTNYDVLRVQEVEYIKYKHYILIDISQSYLTGLPVETLPSPLQGSFHTELVIMSSLAVNSTPVYYDLYKNLPFVVP